MADVYVYDLPTTLSLNDSDFILVNIGTSLKRIRKDALLSLLNVLSNDEMSNVENLVSNGDGNKCLTNNGIYKNINWGFITEKPFTTLDSDEFTVTNDELSITNYHTHTNKTTVLDKLTTANDKLLFDGAEVGIEYTLPTASTSTLGGVKVDGTTITITDGVISGSNGLDFAALTTALTTGTKSGINITADTTNNNFDFEVIGETIQTYANDTAYSIGDIVVYDNNIYKRVNAGTDTEWTSSNWTCLSSGTTGQNAYVHIKYSATQPTQDSDISDTPNDWMGVCCDNTQTASTTYTDYTWYKIKGETGANGADGVDGQNGADGASPTIDSTSKHWFIGTVDTNVIAEGKAGSTWYTGTTYPETVNDGDLFLSFASATLGNVYKYSATLTSWELQGNIYGGGAEIDDTTASISSCYSSTKTSTLINANKTIVSNDITLAVADWDSTAKTQTISNLTIDTTKLNTPLPSTTSLKEYASCGVYLSGETSTSLTFTCDAIPSNALTIKLKSEVIT